MCLCLNISMWQMVPGWKACQCPKNGVNDLKIQTSNSRFSRQTRGAGVKNFGWCFHDICASQVHGIVPKRNMAFAQASPGKALSKNREMGGGKGWVQNLLLYSFHQWKQLPYPWLTCLLACTINVYHTLGPGLDGCPLFDNILVDR